MIPYEQIKFHVPGRPVPAAGHGADAVRLAAWRNLINTTLRSFIRPDKYPYPLYPKGVMLTCHLEFVMAPQSARTGGPSVNQLERAVFDALNKSRVWHSERQVTAGYRSKRHATRSEMPGVHITLVTYTGGPIS